MTALDASGAPLCTSLPFAFEKPAYTPPPTERSKENDGGSDDGSGAGSDGSGGPGSGGSGSGSDGEG